MMDFSELRRQSYISCLEKNAKGKTIVGIFGELPEAMLRAFDLYPVPLTSLDGYIYRHGVAEGCDVIRSTLIYLKTEKCPILYSSDFLLCDTSCPAMIEALQAEGKEVLVYENPCSLMEMLRERSGRAFSEEKYLYAKNALEDIHGSLSLLAETDLSSKTLFEIEFFSNYILDLDERKDFLDTLVKEVTKCCYFQKRERKIITAKCPGGIYEEIFSLEKEPTLLRVTKDDHSHYVPKGCIYTGNRHISYKEEESNE